MAFVSRDRIHRSPVDNWTGLSLQEHPIDQKTSLDDDKIFRQNSGNSPNLQAVENSTHFDYIENHDESGRASHQVSEITASIKELLSERDLGQMELGGSVVPNSINHPSRDRTFDRNTALDNEEPINKKVIELPTYKLNENIDLDFSKNSTFSKQYSGSPVQLQNRSIGSPRSGLSQKTSLPETPTGSLRGSLKNSPKQSPRSLSACEYMTMD